MTSEKHASYNSSLSAELQSRNTFPQNRFEAWALTPEMRLVLDCCKSLVHPNHKSQLPALLSHPFNEDTLLKLCEDQRLVMVVSKFLVKPHGAAFSDELRGQFAVSTRSLTHSHLRAVKTIVEVNQVFHERGIASVFLKGPVLNEVLFSGEVLRYSNDLDLLVRREQLFEADAALRSIGFFPHSDLESIELKLKNTGQKDLAYYKKGFCRIEMHWKTHEVESILSHPTFNWDSVVAHVPFHRQTVPVLESYHNCLYLCLHAAKHNWSRLRWLLDIALYSQKTNLDWDKLVTLAQRYHLKSVVVEASVLCHQLFGLSTLAATTSSVSASEIKTIERRLMRRLHLLHHSDRSKLGTWEMIYLQSFIHSEKLARWKAGVFFTRINAVNRLREWMSLG